ncbi:MAG: nucleotidyltransferase domain-containing protein [Nitrososphaeria archaeon]
MKPKWIILCVYFARGDFNEGSDIDLTVIGDWNVCFLEIIKVLLDFNDQYLPIEPLGYIEEEFKSMVEDGNPFILDVLKDV